MEYSCFDWQPSTLAAVARILTEAFGVPTHTGDSEPLWDAPDNCKRNVLRCEVVTDGEAAPRTVILKRIANAKTLYDSDDLQPGTIAGRHGTEWAACRFLASLDADPALSPRCYGGDRAEALLVLEDLGAGPNVASLLKGDDPVRAERALLAYAETLGRLHAATCGREAEYNMLRDEIGLPPIAAREDDVYHIHGHLESVCVAVGALGCAFPAAAITELEEAIESLRDPGPFLVFTHGDPCPVNDLMQGEIVRLYDFEYSGFRHALMDGVFNRHLYPWARHRLPKVVLARIESRYRRELARACPEAQDEDHYRHEQMRARAIWMLVTLRFLLERALEQDDYEDDRSENEREIAPMLRQRALIVLKRFADDAEAYACLPALSTAAREIGRTLQTHWGIAPLRLPLYPAFRHDPGVSRLESV